jgi:hypothetical protein
MCQLGSRTVSAPFSRPLFLKSHSCSSKAKGPASYHTGPERRPCLTPPDQQCIHGTRMTTHGATERLVLNCTEPIHSHAAKPANSGLFGPARGRGKPATS